MRQIQSFPGYQATKDGRIWSDVSGRFLSPAFAGRGYLYVKLKDRKKHLVARLVAEAWIGDVSGMTVNHIDGDKTNNCVANLEIITLKENIKHAFRTGLQTTRSASKLVSCRNNGMRNSKLNALQVAEIRSAKGSVTQQRLADLYGVGRSCIGRILRNERYAEMAGV